MSGEYRCNKTYELKLFDPGQIAETVKKIQNHFHVDSKEEKYSLTYEYEYIENKKEVKYDDMNTITDFSHDLRTMLFTLNIKGNYNEYICFMNHSGNFVVSFKVDNLEDANSVFKYIEDGLGVHVVEKNDDTQNVDLSEKLLELGDRIDIIERKYQYNKRLKCFISFRFNERVENYVNKLTRFLELLDIEVITGIDYQPQKISEKVSSKLNDDIDFIIYLVTIEGESYWCRDELSTSYGKLRHIIPIVENGASLSSGILSDWEYINFDSEHIGDVYLRLLEGIKFIKKAKQESF